MDQNLPALPKAIPQPAGLTIIEGEWYKFLGGTSGLLDVQILKIRVHPQYPATYQVVYRTMKRKNLFAREWNTSEMELSSFTKYLADYNKVERVVISPAIVKTNESESI